MPNGIFPIIKRYWKKSTAKEIMKFDKKELLLQLKATLRS